VKCRWDARGQTQARRNLEKEASLMYGASDHLELKGREERLDSSASVGYHLFQNTHQCSFPGFGGAF